jgi:hypothetical protein
MERNQDRSPHRSPFTSPPTKRRGVAPESGARRSLAGALGVGGGRNSSPQPVYSDRFVPSRSAGDLTVEFNLAASTLQREAASPPQSKEKDENSLARATYEAVLRTEMFGSDGASARSPPSAPASPLSTPKRNMMRFAADPRSPPRGTPDLASPYSMSPLSEKSKVLLVSPMKTPRKIARAPYKVFFCFIFSNLLQCFLFSPFFLLSLQGVGGSVDSRRFLFKSD